MTETVRELLTTNLYESLATIAQVDGYSNDAIVRVEVMRGNYVVDRALNIQDDGDTVVEDAPQWKDEYNATFRITTAVATSDQASPDVSISVERSRLVADVRKALMVDYTRGGYAINTTIGDNNPLPTAPTDGYSGDVIFVTVHYRTKRDDPYSI